MIDRLLFFTQAVLFFALQGKIGHNRFQMKAGRQLHTRGFKEGTERAVLQKGGKCEHLRRKQRFGVEHGQHGFIGLSVLRGCEFKHDPLPPCTFALPERHEHTHPRLQRLLHLLRYEIPV